MRSLGWLNGPGTLCPAASSERRGHRVSRPGVLKKEKKYPPLHVIEPPRRPPLPAPLDWIDRLVLFRIRQTQTPLTIDSAGQHKVWKCRRGRFVLVSDAPSLHPSVNQGSSVPRPKPGTLRPSCGVRLISIVPPHVLYRICPSDQTLLLQSRNTSSETS
jgi:hypothetical protein